MTMLRTQQGTAAIEAMFARAQAEARVAFLPYFCIGYPSYAESLRAIESVAALGADGFEIGMPFSDPIADGPTIQAATQIALEQGVSVRKCLDAVRALREKGISQPMLMMSYANPLVAYGVDRFVVDARAAGADGLIVPDLPPEEAELIAESCAREGLALVFFSAPTSNDKRIELAAAKATGFIYVVSLTGITGARKELPSHLTDYVARLRAKTDKKLVLGFGISTPAHARQLRGLTDGFIVASALIRAWERSFDDMRELAGELLAAVRE